MQDLYLDRKPDDDTSLETNNNKLREVEVDMISAEGDDTNMTKAYKLGEEEKFDFC